MNFIGMTLEKTICSILVERERERRRFRYIARAKTGRPAVDGTFQSGIEIY